MQAIRLLAILLVLMGVSLAQEDNPVKRKKLAPQGPAVEQTDITDRDGETLSTAAEGLDSLGVLPDEMTTEAQGGTRRVKLETTVFKRHEPVKYEAAGLRDPFRALVADEKKEGEIKTDLLRLEDALLTGVVWSDGQYLAMVRDKDSKSFFLREGDAIYSGRVLYVGQTEAVFEVTEFGDYNRITLKVQGQ
ncbi:MAG: hypothetical protein H6506_00150 [Calditrichaeota bacterium]|nr:hypothetical protein [Calditrichota bacterium]MCB9391050.1 hypothetical protein [Calditrichota bacterium]